LLPRRQLVAGWRVRVWLVAFSGYVAFACCNTSNVA
jgi:hypothetical protein